MKKLILNSNFVIFIRLLFILCTIGSSFQPNLYSFTFLILSLSSLYLIDKKGNVKLKTDEFVNPLKSLKKSQLNELPQEKINKAKDQLFDHFFIDYSDADSLRAFQTIKNKSECIFAKKSYIWGSQAWNENISIEENVKNLIPSFILFCNFCTHLKLDGYLVQVSGQKYGHNLENFAKVFNKILTILAQNDPNEKNCMKKNINSSSWVFEFSQITFFITTFLPIYNDTHSRSTFGIDECFILFQPEVSFLAKNLVDDTPITNWKNPITVRDKIRIAFKNANKEYLIRDTINYPMAHDMIKPLSNNDPIIEWWRSN